MPGRMRLVLKPGLSASASWLNSRMAPPDAPCPVVPDIGLRRICREVYDPPSWLCHALAFALHRASRWLAYRRERSLMFMAPPLDCARNCCLGCSSIEAQRSDPLASKGVPHSAAHIDRHFQTDVYQGAAPSQRAHYVACLDCNDPPSPVQVRPLNNLPAQVLSCPANDGVTVFVEHDLQVLFNGLFID